MRSVEIARALKSFLVHVLAIASLILTQIAHGAIQYINQNAPAPLEIAVRDDSVPGVWVQQPNNARIHQYYSGFGWASTIQFIAGDTTSTYSTRTGGLVAVSNTTSGSGTTSNPFVITTVVDVGDSGVRLTQRVSYVNGDRTLRKTWSLTNSSETLYEDLRFFHGGDTYFGG